MDNKLAHNPSLPPHLLPYVGEPDNPSCSNSNTGLIAGVEIGHKVVTIILATENQKILQHWRAPISTEHSYQALAPVVREQLQKLINASSLQYQQLQGIGFAIPAPFQLDRRRISAAKVLPGWGDCDLISELEQVFSVPVYIDNDANLGALGEHLWGLAKEVDDLIYLKISNGLGAGILLNGQVYRGADGSAGELGHIRGQDWGRLCRCGNRGCLETIASESALQELIRPLFGAEFTVQNLLTEAKAGNLACQRILDDTGQAVGQALANLANTLNPRLIIFGGQLGISESPLVDSARAMVKRYTTTGINQNLQLEGSALGLDAPALGAISLVLQTQKGS